jgi:hypothetical protein
MEKIIERKICSECKIEKDISNFSKKYKTSTGEQRYQPKCKDCVSKEMEIRRIGKEEERKNYDKIYYEKNKEKILSYKKEYHQKNQDTILKKKKDYRDKPESKLIQKIYRQNNKEYIKSLQKDYRDKHPEEVIWRNILWRAIKHLGTKKEGHTIDMLGYSATDLKNHIESLFKEGMSWINFGEWEVDHIKPVSKWSKDSLISDVNALSNLQPLWKEENRAKFNKFE